MLILKSLTPYPGAYGVYRIGVLGDAPSSFWEVFRQGLQEIGYVEGKNLVIEYRWGQGKYERLPDLAAELVRLKADIIVTSGVTAIRSAKQATSTIPIVMVIGSDPVARGLIVSLARPGGNLTGLARQEEARHSLFFINWEAYLQARRPLWQRPRHLWRGVMGRGLQVWQRLQMAYGLRRQGDFTVKGHQAMHDTMSPRGFLELCLQENARRLGRYDARLLRPRLVPLVATTLSRVLR